MHKEVQKKQGESRLKALFFYAMLQKQEKNKITRYVYCLKGEST